LQCCSGTINTTIARTNNSADPDSCAGSFVRSDSGPDARADSISQLFANPSAIANPNRMANAAPDDSTVLGTERKPN
jgi:hypothetical protein